MEQEYKRFSEEQEKPVVGKKEIYEHLRALDSNLDRPQHIIICGGAAVVAKYGIHRYTDDIDILDADFNVEAFNELVKKTLNSTSPMIFNDAAKIYINELTADFRNRLIPSDEEYKHLKVDFISKADLISMKLLALRDDDMKDIVELNIKKDDLPVIYSNIMNYAKVSSACVDNIMTNEHIVNNFKVVKALNVLERLGASNPSKAVGDVESLLDLIKFYEKSTGKLPSFSDVEKWQNDILHNVKIKDIADGINSRNIVDVSDDERVSL
ncbi:MAG: DUF6036 family nucleotidyltransferase [Chitinispirillia bacterium]|nr:DUF6036 family nucleotidyltransferase [Chitinispirillia bacterium]